MERTGYGRSTRPAAMNDPCNLSAAQQPALPPGGHTEVCTPSYGQQMTTIASDWNDIGAVVDYLRALRGAAQVSMVSWSLGGPRAAGYAAQNPDKVGKLVLLAPAYSRDTSATPPTLVPAAGAAMGTQSRDELTALWNRQVGCPDQYEQGVFKSVWQAMLDSAPVGATCGPDTAVVIPTAVARVCPRGPTSPPPYPPPHAGEGRVGVGKGAQSPSRAVAPCQAPLPSRKPAPAIWGPLARCHEDASAQRESP